MNSASFVVIRDAHVETYRPSQSIPLKDKEAERRVREMELLRRVCEDWAESPQKAMNAFLDDRDVGAPVKFWQSLKHEFMQAHATCRAEHVKQLIAAIRISEQEITRWLATFALVEGLQEGMRAHIDIAEIQRQVDLTEAIRMREDALEGLRK